MIKIFCASSLILFSTSVYAQTWKLLYEENFEKPFSSEKYSWVKDSLDEQSGWQFSDFDDNGKFWHQVSGEHFKKAITEIDIYRKRIELGKDNWLTVELAAIDKYKKGKPDSIPTFQTVTNGLELNVPAWDSAGILRATNPLPANYRIEMTLKAIDFGGLRKGKLEYDGKFNGYSRTEECQTNYPWFHHALGKVHNRCEFPDVTKENGFYYLAILDYAKPAPHNHVAIHFHRKVVIDGYYSFQNWSDDQAICNPKTGNLYSIKESGRNVVNGIFVLGDRFKFNFNNGYLFKTNCGEYIDVDKNGKDILYQNEFGGIISQAELQPELMPNKTYKFAIERLNGSYTIEMSGDFKNAGEMTIRKTHKFMENNLPIWHYNQTAEEYQGEFNQTLEQKGINGSHFSKDIWQKGSAYPDNFIIGDPHLNYYSGKAVIDDIKLYVPEK